MDGDGLWNLFWATGSPLVWLVMRRRKEGETAEIARTAFQPLDEPRGPI